MLIGSIVDPLWYGDWCEYGYSIDLFGNRIDPLWYGDWLGYTS
jgi:hypothetical protein